MKKYLLIIVILLVLLGIILVVIANHKSPEPTKNLLSYWWFHSKSWPCKIQKQEYKEETREVYNQDCLTNECQKRFEYLGRMNFCNYITSDMMFLSANESDKIKYKSCVSGTKIVNIPIHDEIKGQQEKYYYLGISVLKESCPEGYIPKYN